MHKQKQTEQNFELSLVKCNHDKTKGFKYNLIIYKYENTWEFQNL